jgi:hypothetical protein
MGEANPTEARFIESQSDAVITLEPGEQLLGVPALVIEQTRASPAFPAGVAFSASVALCSTVEADHPLPQTEFLLAQATVVLCIGTRINQG